MVLVAMAEITKEKLEELYWDKEMSQREIGEIFNRAPNTISYYFNKYNIKARDIKGKNNVNWKPKKIYTVIIVGNKLNGHHR